MKEELINEVMRQMLPYIDNGQEREREKTLHMVLQEYDIFEKADSIPDEKCENGQLILSFIASKQIEGNSEKSYT